MEFVFLGQKVKQNLGLAFCTLIRAVVHLIMGNASGWNYHIASLVQNDPREAVTLHRAYALLRCLSSYLQT